MSKREALGAIWVCTTCYLAHNGMLEDDDSETAPDREPLSIVGDDVDITAGLLYSEHDSDCLRRSLEGDAPGDYECECERREFSWSSCEGCGSSLGGSRYALTLWKLESVESAESGEASSDVAARLEYLRGELQGERISYGELAELQSLAAHIAPGDVELLEAAGVPESVEEDTQYSAEAESAAYREAWGSDDREAGA